MTYANISSNNHPIETGRYIISTNQITNGQALISNWIKMRIPGAIIYGKQRMGKTKLINYAQHILNSNPENVIPNYHIKWTNHSSKENTFFELMLDAVNHSIPFEGRPIEKRRRLSNYLLSVVEKSNQNKIIFFIDDAHRLKKQDYEWLMDIYNDLESFGISLISFLVAQEEILYILQDLKRKKAMQIIGRFMTDDYRFTGFIEQKDFEDLLDEYDQYTEFPVNSNITFTQHYFKEQYAKGFRLKNYLPQFFIAMNHIQSNHGIVEFKEIPAMYVIRTIENILIDYGNFGEKVSEITVQHWITAIENSGYITANANLYKSKQLDESYLKKQDY